ncbi:hypothetical protein GCM10017557_10480 [Streptomyces aurantiacus]|uniref:Transposase n=1 Tax=Streptomyces aurantiacus TaxID=47760 RepID=A0A7G1NTI0_9ACTN|nr:hypothetical protein GCM10017557_10480 [Streptomyces aurantiacus]
MWSSRAARTRRTKASADPVRVPFRDRRPKRWKRRHNTTHAKTRCLGERTMATVKGRRRRSTNRIPDVVKAVLVLHHASA